MKVCSIVAMSENRVIGVNNTLPWRIPEDLKRFSRLTTSHTVVMGRKTYESLPDGYRPLPNRKNVVVSRNLDLRLDEGVLVISDVREFITSALTGSLTLPTAEIWIIGGAEIFSLTQDLVTEVHLSVVKGEYQGDVYLPEFESSYVLDYEEDFPDHRYLIFKKN